MSFTQRGRIQEAFANTFAVGVLGATAWSAPRLLVLLAIVEPSLVLPALIPLGTLFLGTSLIALFLSRRPIPDDSGPAVSNPFELVTALQFAVVFAGVLLLTRAAEVYLGEGGVYFASALAGVAQMDAITLSLGRQAPGTLAATVAVKGLALALAANCVFKGALAYSLGGRRFGVIVLSAFLAIGTLTVAATWLGVPRL
jgi:uncharacterized membrane protein (DUF4010 family)